MRMRQPIGDIPLHQELCKELFEHIKNKVPEAELIDSIFDGADKEIALKGNDIGIWYLGKSLQMMAEADFVFFVNDYRDYRGCMTEKLVAEKYGKFCVEIEVNL